MTILPIRINDIHNRVIERQSVIKTNCFYFWSNQMLTVKIISGVGTIYSVLVGNTPDQLETTSGQELSYNTGYTIYIPENYSVVIIELSNVNTSNIKVQYQFTLSLDNVQTEENTHYDDLLINNYLPTFKELDAAILSEFDKSDLIKRMLLDFKSVMQYKGTKESIKRFFELIGFVKESLQIFATTDAVTLSKTGDYHILFDNFTEALNYDEDNLPIRTFLFEDLTEFIAKLPIVISLANTYFTLKEQDITLFAVRYSSNIKDKISVTSSMSKIWRIDPLLFRKDIHIDIDNYISSNLVNKVISNCVQKVTQIPRSEVKYIQSPNGNQNLIIIAQEFYDSDVITEDALNIIHRSFGCIFHFNLIDDGENKRYDIWVTSEGLDGEEINSTYKQFIFIAKNLGEYKVTVSIYGDHGAREQYTYNLELTEANSRIDFDILSPTNAVLSNGELYPGGINNDQDLDLDMSSPAISTQNVNKTNRFNYILPLDLVPNDLLYYFMGGLLGTEKWLKETKPLKLSEINMNFVVDETTENISTDLSDSWIQVLSFPMVSDCDLKIRVRNVLSGLDDVINYNEIGLYSKVLDKIFVNLIDVLVPNPDGSETSNDNQNSYQDSSLESWYFITTTEVGIELNAVKYDFILVNKETGLERSIWAENVGLMTKKLWVDYDFPLFLRENLNILTQFGYNLPFSGYISPTSDYISIRNAAGIDNLFPMVRSLFSKMSKINQNTLKLGDIFCCRLNSDMVVSESDIIWNVFNSFTGELLQTSTDWMLKFRINDNICYDVECLLKIAGTNQRIFKPSCVSSFVKKNYQP